MRRSILRCYVPRLFYSDALKSKEIRFNAVIFVFFKSVCYERAFSESFRSKAARSKAIHSEAVCSKTAYSDAVRSEAVRSDAVLSQSRQRLKRNGVLKFAQYHDSKHGPHHVSMPA